MKTIAVRLSENVFLQAYGNDYKEVLDNAIITDNRRDRVNFYFLSDLNGDSKMIDLALDHISDVLDLCTCQTCRDNEYPCQKNCADDNLCEGCLSAAQDYVDTYRRQE